MTGTRAGRAAKLQNRVLELDVLRGIAVLLMVCDHFFYDLWDLLPSVFRDFPGALSDFAYDYWKWDVRFYVRLAILFVFFALTGICCSFSHSNLKRGAKLLALAMALTLGTYIAGLVTQQPNLMIVFGVLHCLALCLLLVGVTEKLHMSRWGYLLVGLLLWGFGIAVFCISRKPGTMHVPFYSYSSMPFPELFGKSFLGFCMCGSDCFAFPEVCGQVFIGVFLGKQFYQNRTSVFGAKYRNNLLTFFGRHSLWVYFAHQILLPFVAAIVLLCMGYSLAL